MCGIYFCDFWQKRCGKYSGMLYFYAEYSAEKVNIA
ncbi:MAG: hypothetical protein US90_C0008G0021 [Candidatus Shapirobacteria bacterium GW2011_GWE2_38_30]|uniref:Uncharacterized protein n=1 Tax=Candidatus Shapirobacteria bacterium GW2011_GWE2_38_30 TaxID=1618490 RepID=A0A0G0M904_9BACT|nr:MAG: hypothetical protein US90_C0008G0021 [Candidatus Shapirobacteria bacterium GW2011_GWE2_38_30]